MENAQRQSKSRVGIRTVLLLASVLAVSACEKDGDSFDGLSRHTEVIEDGSGGWTFATDDAANGVAVRYLAHSQSRTNYARNRVSVSISVNGHAKGTRTDAYASQTTLGTPIEGFWRVANFAAVTLQPGDSVTVVLTVSDGDYRNYVSEVEVRALQ